MATHSSILACESHGQRSRVSYSPWGHKESEMTQRLNNNHNLEPGDQIGEKSEFN